MDDAKVALQSSQMAILDTCITKRRLTHVVPPLCRVQNDGIGGIACRGALCNEAYRDAGSCASLRIATPSRFHRLFFV